MQSPERLARIRSWQVRVIEKWLCSFKKRQRLPGRRDSGAGPATAKASRYTRYQRIDLLHTKDLCRRIGFAPSEKNGFAPSEMAQRLPSPRPNPRMT